MQRTCDTCKKNEDQSVNACGYIPTEQRKKGKVYINPYFSDIALRSDICPVYTYLENLDIYEVINSEIPLDKLHFTARVVMQTHKNYMNLKRIADAKSKGGTK